MPLPKKKIKKGTCPYCVGKGYNQLLLGGTETCYHCRGSGNANPQKAV